MSETDFAARPSVSAGESATDFPLVREWIEPLAPATFRDLQPPARFSISDSVDIEIYDDLGQIEPIWRAFEHDAECTVFQAFDWLAKWQIHIGTRSGTVPAIVVARNSDRRILFILPLAIAPRGLVRRLTWLGSDLCDYNGPILGAGVAERLGADRFVPLWRQITERLRADPRFRFDVIDLQKMPETIGGQRNPFLDLQTLVNPSGAYVAILGDDWDQFYAAKRSGPTRKKERKQLSQLAEHGEIRFVEALDTEDIGRTLDTLIAQKERSFARMGVDSIFARPGYRAFFSDVAAGPGTGDLTHVSRLDVGAEVAAASLGLRFRACYYLILSSYHDGDVSRFGPGRAHLHELLRYTIDCGYRRFDFTIGDEPYKRDWSDIELKLHDHLAAVTMRGRLVVAIMAALRRTKRFIKQTPALWDAFSKARSYAASIGRRGTTDAPP